MPELILASASPRRRDLLARLGLDFDVRPVDIDENRGRNPNPQVIAARLARMKGEAARLRHGDESLIITADSVVALDANVLGKPADPDEARVMFRSLRGKTHEVVTAVAVMPTGKRSPLIRNPLTHVRIRAYSETDMENSIARGDPFDKAGGYAIQDELFHPVESYDGCYCNVVGLPLWSTIELLRRAGIPVAPELDQLLPQCSACPLRPDSR